VSGGQQPLRNLIHLMTGLAAAWVLLMPAPWRLAGLGAVLAVSVAVDLGRFHGPFRRWLDRVLPGVFRPDELGRVSGASLLAAGYLAAAALFAPVPAAGGILALAVGDPAAALAGRWYGGPRGLKGKTWVGSLACFGGSWLALMLLPGHDPARALAGAAMAALIERRAGRLDNLILPSGVAMLLNLWT
jgi:dolichol kinase